jgi:hypothetical protein
MRDCETGNTVYIRKTKNAYRNLEGIPIGKGTIERPRIMKEQSHDRSQEQHV